MFRNSNVGSRLTSYMPSIMLLCMLRTRTVFLPKSQDCSLIIPAQCYALALCAPGPPLFALLMFTFAVPLYIYGAALQWPAAISLYTRMPNTT